MPLVSRSVSRNWVRARTPPALPGQRIGILGGTFNPPHAGHVQITKTALHRLRLDRVWWVVTPGNPLKSNGNLPSLEARMAACRQLLATPKVAITGFEADLGTPYTAATLDFLRRRYPGVHFVWIMGADNLASFHRWQRWRDIAAHVPIAVVDRPGWHLAAMASPAARSLARSFVPERESAKLPLRKVPAWTMLGGPLSPLSSTALRAPPS
jgi:nicotinate-nucleotide adenylyltransferase